MLLQYTLLLAETRMSDIGGRYQQQAAAVQGIGTGALVVVGIVILIAVCIGMFIARKPKIVNSPIGLLNELCRVHGINGAGSRLLNEIATAAGMQHPAMIVIGPANFDAAVESATSKSTLDERKKKSLGLIRRQLFGT